ncbi:MAG: LCP family protein [Clostridia bacterium]|nr:LCP family protein [Clostridia bacterium]
MEENEQLTPAAATEQPERSQKKPYQKLRTAFFALCVAFLLLAVLGIVLGTTKVQMCREVRFFSCDSRGFHLVSCGVQTVKREYAPIAVDSLPTPDAALFGEAMRGDVDYYETGEIKEVPIYEQKKIDKFIFSMVIVVQNGSIASDERQTDMIYLASWNPLQQKFTAVSVARDTLVPLSEDEWKRINTAYARGGVGLLINTINDVFGLDIQNYVVTGTDELITLADGVNGIPATLSKEEAAYINEACGGSLTAGKQQLSGEEIVTLLSDRTSDNKGDLGRADRQAEIVDDAFRYMQDQFSSEFLYPFFRTIFKSIRTNVDFDTLRGVGYEMAVSDELTFETLRLPFDDAYTELNVDGAYAVLPAFEKNRILLRQALYGKDNAESSADGTETPSRAWVLPIVLSVAAVIGAGAAVLAVRRGKKKRQGFEKS